MVNWKRNLVFVWLSQFLSISGFAFAMPFVPYYMQELGVTDPQKLKIWVAVFAAAAPLSLAVCSPLWGMLADRYGRRLMLLRANLGAAVFLALMGTVNGIGMLLLIRTFQGVLTGTMTAAQTMVASHTPRHRSGFALGILSSAVHCGVMAGASLGGICADLYGYRQSFFMGSGLLVLSAVCVVFGTSEDFVRQPAPEHGTAGGGRTGLAGLRFVWPALLLMCVGTLLRRFDTPFLPLLVKDIHGAVEGASTRMGALAGVASLAGFLSGILFGHLADRSSPLRIARLGAIGGGLLLIPQALAHGFVPLFALRFAGAFCIGGFQPVLQSWLAKAISQRNVGFFFGLGATLRAFGWGLAPLISGLVALAWGVRAVFVVGGVLFVILGLVTRTLASRLPDLTADGTDGTAPDDEARRIDGV
jgi:MFS transporter, DHA1 family, multidrug resistance protein